ncbi:hypothetical protein TNCV_4253701 [Trichonephila clavipes]|nr:hypothetical protein TNCV_4253701 [Trichonephila clavipes]
MTQNKKEYRSKKRLTTDPKRDSFSSQSAKACTLDPKMVSSNHFVPTATKATEVTMHSTTAGCRITQELNTTCVAAHLYTTD